jgi:AraC-like DNA-binding protein
VLIDPVTFRRTVRARDLLACEVHDELSLRDVAARVGVSPSHLIRSFGALFGDTPHQFRTRMRLERAKALLARGDTVTDACMQVGFSSLGSFSTLFTRWVGVAPSAFRRSFQVPRALAPAVDPGCVGILAHLPPSAWSHFREAALR